MSRVGLVVYRVVLFAYPADFRRAFGGAMVQSVVDRHRHDGVHLMPLIVSEVVDAARAAPRMRWESPMNRIVILITGATVAAAVALAVSPWALIPIAGAVCAASLWWLRQAQPVPRASSRFRRGLRWLVAGAGGIGLAVAIPAVDGGELSGFWWTIFAISLLGGVATMAIGVLYSLSNREIPAATTHR